MAYFACNSNFVNEYWINSEIDWYCGFKFFYHCQISPLFFPLWVCCLLYVFIVCHLSKIGNLQSEIKHGFIWPKTFDFLFQNFKFSVRKNDLFLESIFSINIGRNNFQFS